MKSFTCRIYLVRILVGVVLSVLLWGCNDSNSIKVVLAQAERMIESAPDSALQVLHSIKQPQQLRGRAAARYALSRTMAERRCHHVFTSDSLIQIAVDYYGTHSGLHSALAYYCLGCVYSELGNDEAAVDAYLRAKELFPDKQNRYYGLVASRLAIHFREKNMYDKSMQEFYAARDCLKALEGEEINLSLIEYQIAQTLLSQHEYAQAEAILMQIAANDSTATRYCRIDALRQLAKIAFLMRDYDRSLSYIDSCMNSFTIEEHFVSLYSIKASDLIMVGQIDSALHYCRVGLTLPYEIYSYSNIYSIMANAFRIKNEKDSVMRYYNLEQELNETIRHTENNNGIHTVLARHQVEKSLADRELQQRREKYTRYRIVAIVGCVIAALLILFVWLIKRYNRSYSYTIRCLGARYPYLPVRAQSSPAQLLLESASQTSLSCSSCDDSFTDVLQTCAESFKSTALYEELFSIHIKEAEIMQLHHYTRSEELREGMFVHFEPVIRELCAHVRLSDKHIIHCLCRYLGIPTATIAYCLHTTVRSLSKDKTRLQQKLSENYAVVLLGNGCRRGRPKSL